MASMACLAVDLKAVGDLITANERYCCCHAVYASFFRMLVLLFWYAMPIQLHHDVRIIAITKLTAHACGHVATISVLETA